MSAGAPLNSRFLARALLLATCCASVAQAADDTCPEQFYSGFDSRLQARPVAALPGAEAAVVDFAMRAGRPVIAAERRILVASAGGRWSAMPIMEGIRSLLVAPTGLVRVTTRRRVIELGQGPRTERPEANDRLLARTGKHARPWTAEVINRGDSFAVEAITEPGQRFTLVELKGKPEAVGWNSTGLSFVADNTLWAWRASDQELRALGTDVGLGQARSSCLLPNGSVIVGLRATTLLVSANHALVLAGAGMLCDADGTKVNLLDPKAGIVWEVAGLERVGTPGADLLHARQLVRGEVAASRPAAVRRSEAARIVGCGAVRSWIDENAAPGS